LVDGFKDPQTPAPSIQLKAIRYTPVLNLQSAPLSATKYITIIDNTQNNIPELEPFFALLIAGIVATVLFLQKNRA
jgi:hypothetical protein